MKTTMLALASVASVVSAADMGVRNADPSIIIMDSGAFLSVETDNSNGFIYTRQASTLDGLGSVERDLVWTNPEGWEEVWAPEIIKGEGSYIIDFAAGPGAEHRMYSIDSTSPDADFSEALYRDLADDLWAIDGVPFFFEGDWWYVWSGWERNFVGGEQEEQGLYIQKMDGPLRMTGPRYVIAQPREWWERVDSFHPSWINEAPQPIVDPSGNLHVVYSANGSWGEFYCLADLRLKTGGDPTNVFDWGKSDGCLFSSAAPMRDGWDSALYTKGVGHNSFVLPNGDVNKMPPAGTPALHAYHGVDINNTNPPNWWDARRWYSGTFVWWGPDVEYECCQADSNTTGWSLKFFE